MIFGLSGVRTPIKADRGETGQEEAREHVGRCHIPIETCRKFHLAAHANLDQDGYSESLASVALDYFFATADLLDPVSIQGVSVHDNTLALFDFGLVAVGLWRRKSSR